MSKVAGLHESSSTQIESPSTIFYIICMILSPATASLLSALDAMSGNKLTRRDDLGTLLELGASSHMRPVLEELSFYAKFLQRTHGIMKRIGKDGNGYDKLSEEFGTSLGKANRLIGTLLDGAPPDVRAQFSSTYLAMTQGGLANLLALFYDLSWYKNRLIDAEGNREGFP